MKIAIPSQNGNINPELGKATEFTIITTENKIVQTTELMPARGEGNIAAVSFLADVQADVLICGEIGLMARNALQMIELILVPGCTGDVQKAVSNFLAGIKQGDSSILDVEVEMDENDPMQCMSDCSKCGGCSDSEMLKKVQQNLPKA